MQIKLSLLDINLTSPEKFVFFFFFFKFVLSKTAEEKYYSSTVTIYESSNFENTMQFQKLIQN